MTRVRNPAAIVIAMALLAVSVSAAAWIGGYRINETPSYPIGLWRVSSLDRRVSVGDLVLICPPESETFKVARERGYLRFGPCPGWVAPLIKRVAAVAGQEISVSASIAIDGTPLAHSELRHADAAGRTLSAYGGGAVPPDFLFLHSDFPGSYDSRYFGPIPASGIIGLARPVLTFHG
ncbi:MAG: conjugative transfer signal peptidase TraF [Pseudomonadota bacterium]